MSIHSVLTRVRESGHYLSGPEEFQLAGKDKRFQTMKTGLQQSLGFVDGGIAEVTIVYNDGTFTGVWEIIEAQYNESTNRLSRLRTVASSSGTLPIDFQLNGAVPNNLTIYSTASHQKIMTHYMYPIHFEESGILSPTAGVNSDGYQWSLGNGAQHTASGGYPVFVPDQWICEVVSMSLILDVQDSDAGSTTATVALANNGVSQSAPYRVSATNFTAPGVTEFTTPFNITNGARLNLRTISAGNSPSSSVGVLWLRMRK